MELFDFGMPALDKALNLTATVLLLLALGMLLIRVILRLCDRAFDRSERLAPFRTYLRSTLRAVLYILLALAVLGSIGVEITSFVALLSVAGLAVSLSLQNTLSNVAGGVMLLISKPFTVGDYVSCDGIEGAVRAVDLAYTTFTTVDNKEIFVPNSQIVTAKIVNYNALGRRRVDLTYTASYDAPTETVRTAILEAVAAFPQVTDEPAPTVVLSEYGASSISYLVRLWVSAADYWTVYYGMNEKVRETFAAHGVEMTYDHLNVHMINQLFLSGAQLIGREQVFPVGGQRSAGRIDLRVGGIALHHGVGAGFVDDARRDEFFLLRVLDVTQTEQDAAALSRGQFYMDVQRTNRSPAMGDAAGAMACPNGLRVCRAAIYAAECITGGVKAADGAVGPENSVVVTALAVFGLMIDSAALHLDFTGGEIALEVGAVVHSVPQTELHIAEHIQLFYGIRLIFQSQAVQLTGIAGGHEQLLRSGNTVLLTLQNGIAQTVAAGVAVQLCLGGLPAGVPDGIAILDVNVVAVHIQRGAVIAVAGQAAHPRIAVKAVAARRI